MGYWPRLRRTDQYDRDLLLHIWPIVPSNLVTSTFIRCSHLLRPSSRFHGRNDLVSRYAYHRSDRGCQRCIFGPGHLLGGVRTECAGRSAYRGRAIRVFPETSRKAGGRSVLHINRVMWGNGYAECFLSLWSKTISAGRLEGTENHMSRLL